METAASLPKTSGITLKDKFGYALGDTGGVLIFSMVGSFLQMFYSDVLHINLGSIAVLLLIVRIWDGINDPICGVIIDRRKPSKNGKFRPYLRGIAVPLAISGVLLFTRFPGLSETQYLFYAFFTHILYEGCYTIANIPYGSMASVITDDGMERAQLSMYRSVGSGAGGLPSQIIMPMFIYSTSAAGAKYLDGNKLFVAMLVLASCTVGILLTSFHMTKERIAPPPVEKEARPNLIKTVGTLLHNRPFLVLCFASMLMIGATFYTQTVYNYLYKDYFAKPELYSLVTIAANAPTVLLLPVINKLVARLGKKKMCAYGLLLSVAANVLALLLRTENPYLFMIFCFLSGIGVTFLTLEVWALATDVIDYQELLSHRREEGTCYAFFSFTRKLGQTMAGSGSSLILKRIGYDVGSTQIGQGTAVVSRMYTVATLVPAIAFFLMFLALAFLYPLGKREEENMREELRRRRVAEG